MHIEASEPSARCSYLGAGRFEGAHQVSFHHHEGLELIAVTAGACSISIRDTLLHGTAGVVFVIPPATPHDQRNHGHAATSYVTLHASPVLLDQTPRTVRLGLDSWVVRWIENLCDLNSRPSRPAQEVGDGLVWAIVHHLAAMERGASTGHEALDRAVRAIETNLRANHTVQSLARAACVSPGYLITLFRTHLGAGPIHYLQGRRIALAKRLLREPYLTIAQIAQRCGYDDPNYFSRLFRKSCGCSPGQYRRQNAHTAASASE
ncbi:MAG: helix-turn-helix domain-containing protein [Chitinivibrionales bacterium]|nr:helix-turn-helix domain-containing protein [Chitinivibrionales bacterium]